MSHLPVFLPKSSLHPKKGCRASHPWIPVSFAHATLSILAIPRAPSCSPPPESYRRPRCAGFPTSLLFLLAICPQQPSLQELSGDSWEKAKVTMLALTVHFVSLHSPSLTFPLCLPASAPCFKSYKLLAASQPSPSCQIPAGQGCCAVGSVLAPVPFQMTACFSLSLGVCPD